MSRTYKDRPIWVKRNDRQSAGREYHSHNEWRGWGAKGSQSGPCTIDHEVTRDNYRDLECYWEPFNQYCGYCGCVAFDWVEGPRRAEERDVMLQYKKEYNSGEEELSFEDDVFNTSKRHDYDPWWCC